MRFATGEINRDRKDRRSIPRSAGIEKYIIYKSIFASMYIIIIIYTINKKQKVNVEKSS